MMPKSDRARTTTAGARLARFYLHGAACTICGIALCAAAFAIPAKAQAQGDSPGWAPGVTLTPPDENGWTTESSPAEANEDGAQDSEAVRRAREALEQPALETGVLLSAKLTEDGARLRGQLIWRIYEDGAAGQPPPKLLHKRTGPSVRQPLPAGRYIVNVSFGRSFLTRRIEVTDGVMKPEVFVINAGGLRLTAYAADKELPSETVSFEIFEAETDQSGERRRIIGSARPGQVIRLNAGIYHLRSTYGEDNASVESEASVEAGKLTEVAMAHAAARVTLRLVARSGGEAIPATRWTIATPEGDVVTRSVGALPSHILAPGRYIVTARNGGREFVQEIALEDAQMAEVEVLAQ